MANFVNSLLMKMSNEERFVSFKEKKVVIDALDQLAERQHLSRSDLIRFGIRGVLKIAQRKRKKNDA